MLLPVLLAINYTTIDYKTNIYRSIINLQNEYPL